jgi:hypothetical protein
MHARSPAARRISGDANPQHAQLLELQRVAGNRAVAGLMAVHAGGGKGGGIKLHGQTLPNFDGGSTEVLDAKVAPAKGCKCPPKAPCLTGSGTLRVTYSVDVTITMPDMPTGLTACQQRRVRDFLTNVLEPHEQEHARRLRTYDGTTTRPFSVNGCGRAALDSAVNKKLQKMHNDEAAARASTAEKLSLAIDPFDRPIDLNCK